MHMPAFAGYFADPFVLALEAGGYVAYGSGEPPSADSVPNHDDRVFEALYSDDLLSWESRGRVLERVHPQLGDEYWAPEVAFADGVYWLYYSVGHGIAGHHIRVARSESPFGPFVDLGENLTPHERFAIDAHPFRDSDGQWYIFFARDVLDARRAGTHLAVAALATMTSLASPPVTVLEPTADWQIYERNREMYGRTLDWHTLEGPAVVNRAGRYWLTYSAGAWTGPGYAVSWASAEHPLGPWAAAPPEAPAVLESGLFGLIGPGHNSITVDPSGRDVIAFHSWDEERTMRRMHLSFVSFEPEGPRVDGPTRGSST